MNNIFVDLTKKKEINKKIQSLSLTRFANTNFCTLLLRNDILPSFYGMIKMMLVSC